MGRGGDDAAKGSVRRRHGEGLGGAIGHGVRYFIDHSGAAENPGHTSMNGSHDFRIALKVGSRLSRQVTLGVDSCPGAEVVRIQVFRSISDVGGEGRILQKNDSDGT